MRAITKGRHGVRGFTRKLGSDHYPSLGEGQEEDEMSDVVSVTSSVVGGAKPWKRHNNRNKKEKTRRTIRVN